MEGKKITSVDPFTGAIGTLELLRNQVLGKDVSNSDTALRNEIGDITVDTCLATDTGLWETGIYRESVEGRWVIVSQYESQEEAEKDHEGWLKLITNNPTCELTDIDMWNLGIS